MIKVLFVCHGNICRSPMAEYLFRELAMRRGAGDRFFVASAATSADEIGNPVHPGTVRILRRHGISCTEKCAVQMTRADYARYDLLLGMDAANIRSMRRIAGGDPTGKIRRLLDVSDHPRDIADPWYTGDFDRTYADILDGCEALFAACNGGRTAPRARQ